MKALKVNFKDITSAMRFDGSFHLSEGTLYLKKLKSMPHSELGDITSNIFTAGRSKRVYTDKENGYPYLSNSDVVKQSPLDGCKYNSKKFGYDEPSFLKEGMVVTGRVGAIGQTSFVSSELEDANAMGSDNIIRIQPKQFKDSGYIYAFLSSKYGKTLLWRLAAGGVQPYISEEMLKDMPIPKLNKQKVEQIHSLIYDSVNRRMQANKLLQEADVTFHKMNNIEYADYHTCISENKEYSGFKYRISENSRFTIKAKNHSKRIKEIEQIWGAKEGVYLKDYIVKDFKIGPRGAFKRIDSQTTGVEMVSQIDIHRINPKEFKRVLITRKSKDDYANDNQVLFPAVGNGSSESEILFRPTLAYKMLSEKLLSGDIGRLECKSLKHAAYLMVALKSQGGFRMMRAYYYGTQLRRPLWELLRNVKIPIQSKECLEAVAKLAIEAFELRSKADRHENQAIQIIEKEIESWQN